jgi:hypothetical protein
VGKSISEVISKIKGGMSLTTMYEVTFDFSGATASSQGNTLERALQSAVADSTAGAFNGDGLITILCSEAQLPNVSSLTGQTNGLFLGEGQVNYAYGRLFTDVSLGWQCDKDMTPLRFLQTWHNYIYTYDMLQATIRTRGEVVDKVKYPEQYQASIKITKLTQGKKTEDLKPISFTLINAFPHSIDATPLSYGSSQIVNVSASFYYSKYFVTEVDVIGQK